MSGLVESAACGVQLNTTLTEYHIDVSPLFEERYFVLSLVLPLQVERLGSKVGTYSTFLMVVCSAQVCYWCLLL